METIQRPLIRGSVGLSLLLLLVLLVPHAQANGDLLVVKVAPDAEITAVNAAYGTTTVESLLDSSNIFLLQGAPGDSAADLVAQMSDDPAVLHAEMNVIGSAPETLSRDTYAWPEDELATESVHTLFEWEYGGQDAAHYEHQPAVNQLKLAQAHALSQGAGVTVAVLDTGVDLSHPLLANVLTTARYDFVADDGVPAESANGVDDDGDGVVDEAMGHGTHVAGIVHLVAPEAMLMPLRVLDSDGQGHAVVIAEAIRYAVVHGADVINLSLGTAVSSPALQAAVEEAAAAGVIVVAAAGNLDTSAPQYPAAYGCALGATAVDLSSLHKADYASYGPWVGVAAPGARIYSTYPGATFAWWKGTSMATPFAAGQAALLLGHTPALSPADLGDLIGGTARPIDRQNPDYIGQLGDGRLQIVDSLHALADNSWSDTSNLLQECNK